MLRVRSALVRQLEHRDCDGTKKNDEEEGDGKQDSSANLTGRDSHHLHTPAAWQHHRTSVRFFGKI